MSVFTVTEIPNHYKRLIPSTTISIDQLNGFTNYCCGTRNTDPQKFKCSSIFKQCIQYSDKMVILSPHQLDERNGDLRHVIGVKDCTYPPNEQRPCVYVIGLTHDLEYFDGLVPKSLYDSWSCFE
jgi:hypothetical protein